MEINELIQSIGTTGFPIVVALYSLIRLEKTVAENTLVMNKIFTMLELEVKKNE